MAATPDGALLDLLRRVYAHGNSYVDGDKNHGHRIPDTFTDAERQALKDAGLEPNVFVALTHDDAVRRLREAAAQIDLRRAADAFVASMVSSDLAWLTVLPATGLGHAMPAHAMEAMGGGSCRICFHRNERIDPTMRAYFRHLQGAGWGTGSGPAEGMLALEAVLQLAPDAWPRPTPRDIWVFHRLLELLRTLPADTRYSKARGPERCQAAAGEQPVSLRDGARSAGHAGRAANARTSRPLHALDHGGRTRPAPVHQGGSAGAAGLVERRPWLE